MEILPYPKFTFFPLAIVFSEVLCPGDVYIVLGETEHKNKKQTNEQNNKNSSDKMEESKRGVYSVLWMHSG